MQHQLSRRISYFGNSCTPDCGGQDVELYALTITLGAWCKVSGPGHRRLVGAPKAAEQWDSPASHHLMAKVIHAYHSACAAAGPAPAAQSRPSLLACPVGAARQQLPLSSCRAARFSATGPVTNNVIALTHGPLREIKEGSHAVAEKRLAGRVSTPHAFLGAAGACKARQGSLQWWSLMLMACVDTFTSCASKCLSIALGQVHAKKTKPAVHSPHDGTEADNVSRRPTSAALEGGAFIHSSL
eukprot:1161131-Pelagomonas_calceolata.AAC.7